MKVLAIADQFLTPELIRIATAPAEQPRPALYSGTDTAHIKNNDLVRHLRRGTARRRSSNNMNEPDTSVAPHDAGR
jgi:hypothetical protein